MEQKVKASFCRREEDGELSMEMMMSTNRIESYREGWAVLYFYFNIIHTYYYTTNNVFTKVESLQGVDGN